MSHSKKKVLILTSSNGGGHLAIANALSQYLKNLDFPPITKTINTSSEISSRTYRIVGEYFVNFHQSHWQSTNNPKNAKLLHLLSAPITSAKLVKALKSFLPDLIISTSSFTTEEVDHSLKNLKLKIPHLIVIADPFTIHHTWTTYKKADHYLVPTKEAQKILLKRKIPQNKISLTGLPLRSSIFNPPINQLQAQRVLKLDPKKITLFIGGSGEGHGQIYKITKALANHSLIQSKAQLLVVAGKNKRTKTKLDALAKKHPFLKPFGYTDLIDTLLIASDFVIGKPGPNILFESLSLKKPFITTHQPLAQERGNYNYIRQNHLGFVTYSPQQTIKKALQVIKNPAILNQFKKGINQHHLTYLHTPQNTLKVILRYL